MRDPVYKKCRCRDDDGRDLGAACPKLRRSDGTWNPRHGTWWFTLELEAGLNGKRKRIRRGGFASREEAQAARDDARNAERRGADPSLRTMTGRYLTDWIERRVDMKPTARRTYRITIGTYLVPLLGHVELSQLRPAHIEGMFTTIRDWNAKLAAGKPVRKHQRHVGPASMQRIRSVLRKALNVALDDGLIQFNPAERQRVYMETEEPQKPKAWTAEKKERFWADYRHRLASAPEGRGDRAFLVWRTMSLRPSPVMVWEPADLGVFLDYAARHRLSPLYELLADTGMRRGEACGLPWTEVSLGDARLHVGSARVQVGWEVATVAPKSARGHRDISLRPETVAALRRWRKAQLAERLAWGSEWTDTGLLFTRDDGTALHPDTATDTFERLAFAAGLPPVGLHGLRHGWATYALMAGVDIVVVQDRLGHASSKITRDTYTTVLSELSRTAATTVAELIPRKVRWS